jgi:hypothetical protein
LIHFRTGESSEAQTELQSPSWKCGENIDLMYVDPRREGLVGGIVVSRSNQETTKGKIRVKWPGMGLLGRKLRSSQKWPRDWCKLSESCFSSHGPWFIDIWAVFLASWYSVDVFAGENDCLYKSSKFLNTRRLALWSTQQTQLLAF